MTTRNIPAVDRSIGVQAAQDYLTKKEYDEHRRTTKRAEALADMMWRVILLAFIVETSAIVAWVMT